MHIMPSLDMVCVGQKKNNNFKCPITMMQQNNLV